MQRATDNFSVLTEFDVSDEKRTFWDAIVFQVRQWYCQVGTMDVAAIASLGVGAIYFAYRDPLLTTILMSSGLFFYCINRVIAYVPFLRRSLGTKIHFWHVCTLIATLAFLVSLFDFSAQAFFLSGLEDFLKNHVANQTNTVSATAITLVFNAIRGVFLLLVGIAALFAYNQAQQGNDWRPIATQAGLAVGIILSIDVITYLFTGDTGGGGGGGTTT